MISSLIIDLGHPGIDNAFLVMIQHKLAVKYNDKQVLENLHLNKLFKLIS